MFSTMDETLGVVAVVACLIGLGGVWTAAVVRWFRTTRPLDE